MRYRKAVPPSSDRAKNDLVNLLSSLTIVLEKANDVDNRHSVDIGGGTPSPRSFMIKQIVKSLRYSVAICKKAIGQPK